MKIMYTEDQNFSNHMEKILKRGGSSFSCDIEEAVRTILDDVKEKGDQAVIRYSERFDGWKVSPPLLKVRNEEREDAFQFLNDEDIEVLKLAADRIEKFHARQVQNSWITAEEQGTVLGQMVRPMERIGIYVPGGKASYPSSVLMAAVPAKVAGVHEIIMVTPATDGKINPHVLVAANIAGVDSIFKVGGAQAIAALAYGTKTIPRVDKIVGPGNIYVACAKKMVFGDVDIDMIAGPSEVLIISDGTGSPLHIACDLLSQAEHDEMAASLLVTDSPDFARRVEDELKKQLKEIERKTITKHSIDNNGGIIITRNITESIDLANRIAPEHLELAVDNPFEILSYIKNAGAIFLGHSSPEAVGDYLAGPNHILPTGGTARFSSPLGVDDFVKKSSIISFSKEALNSLGKHVIRIAEMEGLGAHAGSVRKRLEL